jgi:glucose/arabinose dehydrogenase
MKCTPTSALLATLLLPALAYAQRDIPMGPEGYPVAPTGLEGRALPAEALTYHTAEKQDIRVTIRARMAWPFSIAALPDGDLLVAQRTGEMRRIPRDGGEPVKVEGGPAALFLGAHGPAVLHGYMHIALHPDFARNGVLYLSYTKAPAADGSHGMVSAVARMRYAAGRLHDVKDVWRSEGFFGPVAVAVGHDGKLYIAISGLANDMAQDPKQYGGKVLRLNGDGSVPSDNPFVGRQGYLPEIFTLGHRSTSALVVHPVSGELYLSEMGPNGGDEINHLRAGANYGWPIVSLGRTYPGPWQNGVRPTHEGFEHPILYWMPSISVSGLTFYQGDALPAWKGDLLVGGLRYGEVPGTGRLERILLNKDMEELRREPLLADLNQRIRDVEAGADGLLYVATDHEDGAILRIEPLR